MSPTEWRLAFWPAAILSTVSTPVSPDRSPAAFGLVAMPTLAAVLIYAAIGSLTPAEIMTVLGTGRTAQIALIPTFAATLFLPVAAAVGVGIALSLILQLNQETIDLEVVRLIPDAHGGYTEASVPKTLSDDDVVILDVYGSLFHAGARALQLRLPDPGTAQRAAVILRVCGGTTLGATFLTAHTGGLMLPRDATAPGGTWSRGSFDR